MYATIKKKIIRHNVISAASIGNQLRDFCSFKRKITEWMGTKDLLFK